MLAFIHLVADAEALMLAKRGGLDLGQAWRAITASSARVSVHETEGQLILNGSYDIAFTMDLALKDLGFAMDYAERFGVPLDLAKRTQAIFEEGKRVYGGSAQSTAIARLIEDATGTDLRAPGFSGAARIGVAVAGDKVSFTLPALWTLAEGVTLASTAPWRQNRSLCVGSGRSFGRAPSEQGTRDKAHDRNECEDRRHIAGKHDASPGLPDRLDRGAWRFRARWMRGLDGMSLAEAEKVYGALPNERFPFRLWM